LSRITDEIRLRRAELQNHVLRAFIQQIIKGHDLHSDRALARRDRRAAIKAAIVRAEHRAAIHTVIHRQSRRRAARACDGEDAFVRPRLTRRRIRGRDADHRHVVVI
jgi:hypothetical protein